MNLSVQPRNLFTESEASGTGVQDQRMCSLMGPSVRTEDSLAKHRGLALNARSVSGKLRSIPPTSDSKTEGWKGRHPPAAHVLVLGAAAPPPNQLSGDYEAPAGHGLGPRAELDALPVGPSTPGATAVLWTERPGLRAPDPRLCGLRGAPPRSLPVARRPVPGTPPSPGRSLPTSRGFPVVRSLCRPPHSPSCWGASRECY